MAGLINNAMGEPEKKDVLGADVYQASTTGYDPATRTVDAGKETVAGQMDTLLGKDSPYITRARAGATQTANQRGLLNSSIAAGAGEAAAIDAAAPIAAADANIYGTASRDNQVASNTALQFGAGETNTTSRLNSEALNQPGRAAQAAELQKGIINSQTQSESQLQSERAAQAATLQQQQTASESRLQSERAGQALTLEEAQRVTQTALQTLRGDQAEGLANIEANYRNLIQASANAGALYKELVTGMTLVMADTNTTPEQKQAAVDRLAQLLQSGLDIAGKIANLDLSGLLDFSNAAA